MRKEKIVIGAALFAALSFLVEYLPLFYKFGEIKIDLVGVPWVLSALLFGLYGGTITGLVSATVMALATPTGWIGALMKFIATMPLVIALGFLHWKKNFSRPLLFSAFAVAFIARIALMLLFNYFVAMPLFFSIPIEAALKYPWWLIVVPNALLSVIEFSVSYFLVFRTKLRSRLND